MRCADQRLLRTKSGNGSHFSSRGAMATRCA